ncbi:hypothetical protein GOODEAATRI_016062, partial [Goodea atripinnis]
VASTEQDEEKEVELATSHPVIAEREANMATLTEKSTKEHLLCVLDDLEVLSRELIEMLALSRGQKLPQPGEDTQVTETHRSKSVLSTSVTGRVCRAVLPGEKCRIIVLET